MHSHPSGTAPTVSTVLTYIAMTVVCIAIVIGMCVRLATDLEPRVGDIAVFHAGGGEGLSPFTVTAHVAGRTCELSSDVIIRGGGSIVVVARGLPGTAPYLVHWMGPRTSAGAADCGASADLALSKSDLLSLVVAAGGFGLNPRGLPRS